MDPETRPLQGVRTWQRGKGLWILLCALENHQMVLSKEGKQSDSCFKDPVFRVNSPQREQMEGVSWAELQPPGFTRAPHCVTVRGDGIF